MSIVSVESYHIARSFDLQQAKTTPHIFRAFAEIFQKGRRVRRRIAIFVDCNIPGAEELPHYSVVAAVAHPYKRVILFARGRGLVKIGIIGYRV